MYLIKSVTSPRISDGIHSADCCYSVFFHNPLHILHDTISVICILTIKFGHDVGDPCEIEVIHVTQTCQRSEQFQVADFSSVEVLS